MIELNEIKIGFWEDLITGFHLEIDGEVQFYYDKNIFIAGKHQTHASILDFLQTTIIQ